jgi:hypothetical protein
VLVLVVPAAVPQLKNHRSRKALLGHGVIRSHSGRGMRRRALLVRNAALQYFWESHDLHRVRVVDHESADAQGWSRSCSGKCQIGRRPCEQTPRRPGRDPRTYVPDPNPARRYGTEHPSGNIRRVRFGAGHLRDPRC